jgi:hypothetical protein
MCMHARVEGFIRCAKATGLARWPSNSFAINTAWVAAVTIAIDLLCWTRLLLLLAVADPHPRNVSPTPDRVTLLRTRHALRR